MTVMSSNDRLEKNTINSCPFISLKILFHPEMSWCRSKKGCECHFVSFLLKYCMFVHIIHPMWDMRRHDPHDILRFIRYWWFWCVWRLLSPIVPHNGLVVYCGTIVTDEGKEKKVNIDFEPFKPINTSLYLCDNKFHTEVKSQSKRSVFIKLIVFEMLYNLLSFSRLWRRYCQTTVSLGS